MVAASKKNLQDLQLVIAKMPMEMCSTSVLPEFGLRWREVSKTVRNYRLPMVPSSVARVICRYAAKALPDIEIADILSRLRLKLTATQDRKWHVIDLQEPFENEDSITHLIQVLPSRVAQALKKTRAGNIMTPDVQAVLFGDLLYMSVQMVSAAKTGSVLYVATPPGQPVALVSSVNSSLLKGCVEGLGYKKHEDAQLFGRDIISLLRMHDKNHNENANQLADVPEYNPIPTITADGIDYTYKNYDKKYVDDVLGPNPPLLTDLVISSRKPFYDPKRLTKSIKLTVKLTSENIAETLRSWVRSGAVAPTSDFFQIFNKVKSNMVVFRDESLSEY